MLINYVITQLYYNIAIILTKHILIMKKVILSALTVGFLFVSGATMAQVSFGPKVALNIASQHDKAVDSEAKEDVEDYKTKVGFQVGGMLNAQINDYFAIRPELTFSNVGAKVSGDGFKGTLNHNYLLLPVNFVGQYPVSDNFKLQAFVGPYAALGLGGKFKYESGGDTFDGSVKFKKDPGTDFDNAYANPLDFGLNFGVGFQASSFVFSASYALGLSNTEAHYSESAIEDERGNYIKTTNRNISIGVAYLFGGK